jgi:Lon protease-like protein
MHDPQPKLHELPETFPVFPLSGALLLPGGRLPLNIFEPRYLAMTEDALASGRCFAMIQPDPDRPVTPKGPGLYRVGCLGRLTSFSETEDGRYLITLTGLIRFDVAEELDMARGYRRVRGDFGRFTGDLDVPQPGEGFHRAELLDALRGYFTSQGFDANWDAINNMGDVSLVTSLAMVCPFHPVEKQALLEAHGIDDRAQTLHALLAMDMHEHPFDDDEGTRRRLSS